MIRFISFLLFALSLVTAQAQNTVAWLTNATGLASLPPTSSRRSASVGNESSGWSQWNWNASSTASTNSTVVAYTGLATGRWIQSPITGVAVGLTTATAPTTGDSVVNKTALDAAISTNRTRSVVSVAAMQALTGITNGDLIITAGRTSAGDGGSARFYYSSASAAATNLGTIFAASGMGSGRLLWDGTGDLNARLFGAIPDDASDDTSSIQAAIDFGSSNSRDVAVSGGSYYITSINVSGRLKLDSESTFALYALPSSYARSGMVNLLSSASIIGGTYDLRLSDFTWPTGYEVFPAINIDSASNASVADVSITNGWRFPLTVRGTTNTTLHNIVVSDSASGPMLVNNSSLSLDGMTIRDLNMDSPTVGQHCLDLYFNKASSFRNVQILNPYSGSLAPSEALSGVTIGGDDSCIYSDFLFVGVRSDVDYPTAFLYDGGANSTVTRVKVLGWCGLGGNIGIEVHAAVNLVMDDVELDAIKFSPTLVSSGGAGVTVQNQGVFRFGSTVAINEGINYPGQQQRMKTAASRCSFSNVRVSGWRDGIQVGSSDNTFTDCEFSGNSQHGIRFRPVDGGFLTGVWATPVPIYSDRNIFTRCRVINNSAYGIALGGGKDNSFIDCTIRGNGYAASGLAGVQALYSVGNETVSSATASTLTTTTVFTTNQYAGFWAAVHTGTGIGQQRFIKHMTTTVMDVQPDWDVTPDATSRIAIYQGETGTLTFSGGVIDDNRQWTNTFGGSLNPNQGSFLSATNELAITTIASGEYLPGQILNLKGVLAGSADLLVRVRYPNPVNPDELIVNPVSPTSGAFKTNWVAGAGTISAASGGITDIASYVITGSGTDFVTDANFQRWMLAGTNSLRLALYVAGSPQSYHVAPLPGVLSGSTYYWCVFDIETVAQQTKAVSLQYWPTPVKIDSNVGMGGTTLENVSVSPNYGFAQITGAYPDISVGTLLKTANTAATTITNFSGGFTSKTIQVLVGDTNTTISFGTSIVGNNGISATLALNDLLTATYDGAKWTASLNQTGTGPFVKKSGDTMTGTLVVPTVNAVTLNTTGVATFDAPSGTDNFVISRTGTASYNKLNFGNSRPNWTLSSALMTIGNSAANAVNKSHFFGPLSYLIADSPFYGLGMSTVTGGNTLFLGGGTASGSAATQIQFYTAAASGTTTGTLRGIVTSAGALDWVGAVSGSTFTSTVATGTAPLTVASTTLVSNLNADRLDGLHKGGIQPASANLTNVAALTAQSLPSTIISVTENTQTGTTYTVLSTDNGKIVTLNNGSAITVTVPTLSAQFACTFIQKGAGQVTFTTSGTTVSNAHSQTKTFGQYAVVTLYGLSSTAFVLAGDTGT